MTESAYVASMTAGQRMRYESKRVITPLLKATIAVEASYQCAYCLRVGGSHQDPDGAAWHIDHVVPVSGGGSNDRDNLALACARCNRIKGSLALSALRNHLSLMLRAL